MKIQWKDRSSKPRVRNAAGTVRADFDTMQEAQDFLTTILNAQGENT